MKLPVRVCKCHGFVCKIVDDRVHCPVDGRRLNYGRWRVAVLEVASDPAEATSPKAGA